MPASSGGEGGEGFRSARSASTLVLGQSPKHDASAECGENPNRAAYVKYWDKFRVAPCEQTLAAVATSKQMPPHTSAHADNAKASHTAAAPPIPAPQVDEPAPTPPNLTAPEVKIVNGPGQESVPAESSQGKPPFVPKAMTDEPCMSPEEQNKTLGTAAPKRKGRPPKSNSKAAAKPKATKPASKARATPKAKAKAKAKAQPRSKAKATKKTKAPPSEEGEPEVDPSASGSGDSNSNRSAKKAKTTASPSKGSRTIAKPTSKASPSTKDKKALLSRKSCAYKKARKQALDAGKSPEDAAAAGKKVT